MQELPIKTVMTTEVRCAAPSTPLSQIIEAMKLNRHSCMVITVRDMPIGMITERDVVRHFGNLLQLGRDHDPVAETIMSAPPITVSEDTTLFDALVIARSNQIRHLPVTDTDGKLIGLITQTDLVTAHFRMIELQTEGLERAIADRTYELIEINRKLKELCLEDPLLKIGNRRAMEADLNHTHSLAARYRRQYAIALLDVDYFKRYNDHYGHAAGDQALQKLGAYLKTAVRKSDRVYRYGGEEFLILFPETISADANPVARRLIEGIADCAIPHELNPHRVLTASAGIGCADEQTTARSWRDVLQQADRALYQAKNQGRNCAVFLGTDPALGGSAEQPIGH
jgi:diguanylate cyclase (GGDEF)-like protein